MKKNGFTLAEVLITLAIIGVVATLTLPALQTNSQEQQAKSALKKAINTLTNAATMNLATQGYDFGTILNYGSISGKVTEIVEGKEKEVEANNTQSLWELLANRTDVDYQKTNTSKYNITSKGGSEFTQTIHLKDGSAILIPKEGTGLPTGWDTQRADGLNAGFVIIYDTNGAKAPNVLSNCQGKITGLYDTGISATATADGTGAGSVKKAEGAEDSDCGDKSKRIIRDQFTLFLRGSSAQPAGAAAIWALNS